MIRQIIIAMVFMALQIAMIAQDLHALKQATFPDLWYYNFDSCKREHIGFYADYVDYIPSNCLWEGDYITGSQEYQRIYHLSQMSIDSQGFRFLKVDPIQFSDGTSTNKIVVLSGAGWFLVNDYSSPDPKFAKIESEALGSVLNAIKRGVQHRTSEWAELPHVGLLEDGIKSISAWSELKEVVKGKDIVYEAKNMKNPIAVTIDNEYSFGLNQVFPPWAEGEQGPGIGGYIDVEFERSSDKFYILNGYVDMTNRHLYKANNRLKTIKIDSEDPPFSTVTVIKDVVQFHEIVLPQSTAKIHITIVDVYNGTKYDDTCITKLFLPQRDFRTKREMESEVEKHLKSTGFLKY